MTLSKPPTTTTPKVDHNQNFRKERRKKDFVKESLAKEKKKDNLYFIIVPPIETRSIQNCPMMNGFFIEFSPKPYPHFIIFFLSFLFSSSSSLKLCSYPSFPPSLPSFFHSFVHLYWIET
jgi:hypothetical protein